MKEMTSGDLTKLRKDWMSDVEMDVFNDLPQKVRVYRVRGSSEIHTQHPDSYSWAADPDGLEMQLQHLRMSEDGAIVETAWVEKDDIAGVFLNTGESEIVIPAGKVHGKEDVSFQMFQEQGDRVNPAKDYRNGGMVYA